MRLIIKSFLTAFCSLIALFTAHAQPGAPYYKEAAMNDAVAFRIPGAENYWHLAFSPDGGTAFYLVDSLHMESMCYSVFEKGEWSGSNMMPFSGKYRIETPSISPDGKRLYFTLPVVIDTVNHYDRAILHMSVSEGGRWSDPREMGKEVNLSVFQNCPRETENGSLYFCSFADSGIFLFKSTPVNGKLSNAVQVKTGAGVIKTADFAIARDESYIIFEQFNDLYVIFNHNDMWTKPVSLGDKVNSKDLEVRPLISPEGKYLFFKRLNPENFRGEYYQIDIQPIVEKLK